MFDFNCHIVCNRFSFYCIFRMEEFSPWNVVSFDEFLFYCCPECDRKHVSKEQFSEHALNCHPESKRFIFHLKASDFEVEGDNGESGVKEEDDYKTLSRKRSIEDEDSDNDIPLT